MYVYTIENIDIFKASVDGNTSCFSSAKYPMYPNVVCWIDLDRYKTLQSLTNQYSTTIFDGYKRVV